MSTEFDDKLDDEFDARSILATINPNISPDLVERLQEAVKDYRFVTMVEQDGFSLPSRAERRDTLQRLIDKARRCAKAFREFAETYTGTDHDGKHNPPDALTGC